MSNLLEKYKLPLGVLKWFIGFFSFYFFCGIIGGGFAEVMGFLQDGFDGLNFLK